MMASTMVYFSIYLTFLVALLYTYIVDRARNVALIVEVLFTATTRAPSAFQRIYGRRLVRERNTHVFCCAFSPTPDHRRGRRRRRGPPYPQTLPVEFSH